MSNNSDEDVSEKAERPLYTVCLVKACPAYLKTLFCATVREMHIFGRSTCQEIQFRGRYRWVPF